MPSIETSWRWFWAVCCTWWFITKFFLQTWDHFVTFLPLVTLTISKMLSCVFTVKFFLFFISCDLLDWYVTTGWLSERKVCMIKRPHYYINMFWPHSSNFLPQMLKAYSLWYSSCFSTTWTRRRMPPPKAVTLNDFWKNCHEIYAVELLYSNVNRDLNYRGAFSTQGF